MRNTYLFGFATFGHPNDYRQSPFIFDDERIAKNIRIFDLSNAIKVFPDTTLFSIRKESIDGIPGVSYSIYTYAKEMTSTREGTFIGSSISYTKEIAYENITIDKLIEFHTTLVRANTINSILKVNHSKDFSHSKEFLSDFEKIALYLKPISDLENFSFTNKTLVVFSRTDANTLTSHFKKSLLLLNKFDNIFFSDNREIVEYCRTRNIYIITDENGFEKEIENIKLENQQKITRYISDIDNEIQKLEEDRTRTLNDFRQLIEQNEKSHTENESRIRESKNDLEKINQFYNDFSAKIKDLANQLKSGRRLDDVKIIYNENKKIFINGIVQLKKPVFINKIPKAIAKSNLRTEPQYQHQDTLSSHSRKSKREQKKENKVDIFKVTTFILLLLLIGTWAYFLVYYPNVKQQPIQDTQREVTSNSEAAVPKQTSTTPVEELNPKPNTELSEKHYRIVAKKIQYGTKVEDIVKIIFEKNPKDIGSTYREQEVLYAKQIIDRNKNCFEEKEGYFLFTKDTLRHIPSYISEK
ncbi:hypothetical protein [Phnomibacter sp. MR]|uniref:hypothetical protein n=1 Tax=Phnomibacter sp. MR TaxID=3042318 RepID=UPI003A80590B